MSAAADTRSLAPLSDLSEEKMLCRSFVVGLVAALIATLFALPAAAQSLTRAGSFDSVDGGQVQVA